MPINRAQEFLHPSTNAHQPLDFEWDPYDTVVLFAAETSLTGLHEWYCATFSVDRSEISDEAPGQLTLYLEPAADGREVSLCIADTSVSDAVAALISYVGSTELDRLLEANPQSIGAVFIRD